MALRKVKLTSDNPEYYSIRILDATAVAMGVFTVAIIGLLAWYWTSDDPGAVVMLSAAVVGFWLSLLIGVTARYLERSISRAYGALHAVVSEPQRQDTD